MFKRALLSLLFITLFLLSGCIQPQAPKLTYQDSDIKFLSFQEVQTKFFFDIENSNPFPLNGSFEYSLEVNEFELLGGASSAVEVGAQDQTSFTITSQVDLPEVFNNIAGMLEELSQGKKTIPFKISGTYKATYGGYPIEVPLVAQGEIPLPTLPSIKLEGIALEKIDLSSATLKINTNIKNSNDFPIDIESFVYNLMSDGSALAEGSVDRPINISSSSSEEVTFLVKVNLANIDTSLIDKIKNNTLQADLQNAFNNIK